MEPSSTPYARSKRNILAARDARQAAIDRHHGAGDALVALSLAVPGADKAPPGAGALFSWGVCEVGRRATAPRLLEDFVDALGPFALWAVAAAPAATKAWCVAIEASRPAARLLDLDVYSCPGAPVDRASLCLPPRACLCCDRPARECIVAGRHGFASLAARARELLAEFPR